jgi:hypothetical protein
VIHTVSLPNKLTGELAWGQVFVTDEEGDYITFRVEEGDEVLEKLRTLLNAAGERDGDPLD